MELRVLLALMLLSVAAFAVEGDLSADDTGTIRVAVTNGSTSVSYETADTDSGSSEETEGVPPAPELYGADGSRYGDCEIEVLEPDLVGEEDIKQVSVECQLQLPTPCHSVSYGWVPSREEGIYIFSVQVREQPGVCAQMIKETSISDEMKFRSEREMDFTYRINYIQAPAAPPQEPSTPDAACERARDDLKQSIVGLEQRLREAESGNDSLLVRNLRERLLEAKNRLEGLDCTRELVQKELPPAALCVRERLELQERLRHLYLSLQKAEESGNNEVARRIREQIAGVKEELDGTPTIARCAQATSEFQVEKQALEQKQERLMEYSDRLRRFNLAIRIANPCDKVAYLDEQIDELEAEVEGSSGEEAEAIKEKIGVLRDVRDAMNRACVELKNNSACAEALQLRNRFRELMGKVESGEQDPARLREDARLLLQKFANLERACLADVKDMFEEHPCMAARALEVELERLSATGESPEVMGDLYERIEDYRERCVEGSELEEGKERAREKIYATSEGAPGPVSERASEVAQVVGELELRKHLILADEDMSRAEKEQEVAKLQEQKLELIREAITEMKRARVSSSVRMRMGPRKLEVEGEELDGEDVTLELPTEGNDTVEVAVKEDRVEMKGRKFNVRARAELDFDNGVLTVNGREITLPEQLMERIRATAGDLELKQEGNETVYEGTARKQYRLFAILPVQARVKLKANAATGDVQEMQGPWWAAFAVE